MIIAERAHAHDPNSAVGLDWEIGFDAEGDFETGRILRIDAELLDAADLRSAGVSNRCTLLNAAREWHIRVKGFGRSGESAAKSEDGGDKESASDQDEQSHDGLLSFGFHVAFPLPCPDLGAPTAIL